MPHTNAHTRSVDSHILPTRANIPDKSKHSQQQQTLPTRANIGKQNKTKQTNHAESHTNNKRRKRHGGLMRHSRTTQMTCSSLTAKTHKQTTTAEKMNYLTFCCWRRRRRRANSLSEMHKQTLVVDTTLTLTFRGHTNHDTSVLSLFPSQICQKKYRKTYQLNMKAPRTNETVCFLDSRPTHTPLVRLPITIYIRQGCPQKSKPHVFVFRASAWPDLTPTTVCLTPERPFDRSANRFIDG